MNHPVSAKLSGGAVFNLPRSLIEWEINPTEPQLNLYGTISDSSFEVYTVHNRSVKRKTESVLEIMPQPYLNLLAYDEAVIAKNSDHSMKIGEAHGHPITCKSELSRIDKGSIKTSMQDSSLDQWLEIVMYYEKINPIRLANKTKYECGIVEEARRRHPALSVFHAKKNLGMRIQFFGFYVYDDNGELQVREIPMEFDESARKYFL